MKNESKNDTDNRQMNCKCVFCGESINKKTKEHILLNSLGGKLTLTGLICEKCNNAFGYKIDSDLDKTIYSFASLLNVKRNRGDNRNISTQSDTNYFLRPGGEPKLKKYIMKEDLSNDGRINISVEAGDGKQSKKAIEYIKKKYGNRIDDNSIITQKKQGFLNEKIPFSYTISPIMFPSIIKSAIEFCIMKTNLDISGIIQSFKNGDYNNCYYCFDDVINIKDESVFHIIALFTSDKTLYCYISYFNIFGFLVKLAYNVDVFIEETYVQDLINDSVVDSACYVVNKDIVRDFIFNNSLLVNYSEKIKEKVCKFLNIYYKNSKKQIINRICEEAENEAFNEYGENASWENISNKFLEKISPYLAYWMGE